MSHLSPFLNSGNLTTKLSNLSPEGIADKEEFERRELASAVAQRLKEFETLLSLLDNIQTEQDAKDVVEEFKHFLKQDRPSSKVQLGAGLKKVFEEVEGLMDHEANHIIDVLKDSNDRSKDVEELKQQSSEVIKRVLEVKGALEKYLSQI
ncbi:unnamed protein product [Rhizoctonia solani]|uniref:Uncharacterized protein n=1 Tax=Rhizoctonia solani TaxID=456999 RepID=A0A8H2X9B3_9AGAM|nr:unnamed protein product [Rhizoctonia solani]